MKKYFLTILVIILFFFYKTIFHGLLPIPSDTIVGLYHPFRDLYSNTFPNGIPFKNFLITDPVRQQYPWRELAVSILKRGEMPLWNPYQFAGTPLLGNLQSAPFYPLNIFFFIMPFNIAWSILVLLQPLLAGFFMFLYLRQIKLHKLACVFGGVTFAFCGFFIAWLEWNAILHVTMWLPLILLSIDKIIYYLNYDLNPKSKIQNPSSQLEVKKLALWGVVFIFGLSSSFLAGHLQVFFYLLLVVMLYFSTVLHRVVEKKKLILLFTFYGLLITIITATQWLPTTKFILNSGRLFDQVNWQIEGWFIPWKHLIQFVAPDFFGNPSTLNYWGVWNYGEFIGFIGITPLILAFLAIFFRKDKKTLFFTVLMFGGLLFATPNPIAKLPFQIKLPFISTSQPTRLLFIIDFSLAILAALGMDYWLKGKVKFKQILKIIIPLGMLYALLWLFTQYGTQLFSGLSMEDLHVSQRNLILPTAIFIMTSSILFTHVRAKNKTLLRVTCYVLLVTAVFDLFRFGWKFTPFTRQEYLFPSTKAIDFLQNKQAEQKEPFRIMATDKRILPPNFSTIYRLQDVAGYDPLYLRNYGEFAAAWVRGGADISPFSFNRIITPQTYEGPLTDLLNIRYILTFDNFRSKNFTKIYEEGQTKIYENRNAYPRAFLVESVVKAKNKQEAIEIMFNSKVNLRKQAIVYDEIEVGENPLNNNDQASIVEYSENTVKLKVKTSNKRLLILSDNYYPSWKAYIYPEGTGRVDGKEIKIYKVDYNLRGIIIPEGRHDILFRINLL